MKKNLRIVSAAAAALLAVAPVAASSVSTALAAGITVPVNGNTTPQTVDKIDAKLNVTNAAKLYGGVSPTQVAANITTTSLPAGATIVPGKADIFAVDAQGNKTGNPITDKLEGGNQYRASVTVAITGLTKFAGKTIKVNGHDETVNGSGIIPAVGIDSDVFTVPNTALKGAPYITYKDANNNNAETIADSGSIDLDDLPATTVDDLDTAIRGKYTVAMTATGKGAASGSYQDLKQDIKDALKAAGVAVKADDKGSFDKPAAPFTITAHLYATNGKTATFAIRVNSGEPNGDATYPYMYFNGAHRDTQHPENGALFGVKSLDSLPDNVKFNYVPVNGVVDVKAIQDAFETYVSGTAQTKIIPKVDISKVNTKVAGKYPVTVSATNADGKTTKVTFLLTVGVKGAEYKTVQSDGDVPVYKIDGNTVTDTKTTVKNGDQIAIFGQPIKIGKKTYVRINSADSDLYVEAKYVDGTFKSAEKTKKTVMHNAYIYDKDHKRVGTNMLRAYTSVEVIGKATKLADGSLVYKIGDNQYVMADNITGTSRTLTHNAYVYKTSRKRANRTVLKKGTTVTTYGAPYTFKNGKRYYRIGGPAKQYVKVANF